MWGADPGLVGSTISVDSEPVTVVGVLSEDSRVIRQRGGPAKVWTEEGREAGIAVEPAPYGAGLVTDRRRPQDLASRQAR